jgi:restriction system protein
MATAPNQEMRTFKIEAEGFPDMPAMMLSTVQALKAIGGSASIQELDEKVAEVEGVTEVEQQYMMPGADTRPRMNYYLAWARTYLRRGGALENSSRGIWALTEFGSSIASRDQTLKIYDTIQQEERDKARAKRDVEKRRDGKLSVSPATPNLPFEAEGPPERKGWKPELLEILKAMEPSAFERLAQRLLREAGFTKVEVRGKSGDGGIDGVGVLRVNLVSFQVFFQCKRWKGSVGASEIRDFRGAMMGRADKGLFITTGTFTSQASDEATRDGATAIDLIDGDRLCDLLKENRLGVVTEMVENVLLDRSWYIGV